MEALIVALGFLAARMACIIDQIRAPSANQVAALRLDLSRCMPTAPDWAPFSAANCPARADCQGYHCVRSKCHPKPTVRIGPKGEVTVDATIESGGWKDDENGRGGSLSQPEVRVDVNSNNGNDNGSNDNRSPGFSSDPVVVRRTPHASQL